MTNKIEKVNDAAIGKVFRTFSSIPVAKAIEESDGQKAVSIEWLDAGWTESRFSVAEGEILLSRITQALDLIR